MLRKICVCRLSQLTGLRIGLKNNKYISEGLLTRNIKFWCSNQKQNMPKQSRFSQQLGLDRQFDKVRLQSASTQKSTSMSYEIVIWLSLCIVGSLVFAELTKQQTREKIKIIYKYFLLSESRQQQYLELLTFIVNYQQNFFANRQFNDITIATIVQNLIQKPQRYWSEQNKQQFNQLLVKCLLFNLNNKINSRRKYSVYKKYFEKLLYESMGQKQLKNIQQLANRLLLSSDLQTIYLIFLLKSKNILKFNLTKDKKRELTRKMDDMKVQIQIIERQIKQIQQKNMQKQQISRLSRKKIQSQLFTQPYLYQLQIKKKWLKFIQNNL